MESLFTCWLDLSVRCLLLAFGHKNDEVTKPAVRPRYGFSFCRGAWSGDWLRSEPDSLVYSRAVGGASDSSDVRLHRAPYSIYQPWVSGPPRLPASPCEKRYCRNHALCRKYRPQILQWLSKLFSLWHHVRLFVTPWTEARQVFLSIAISWSLFKLMSIESVMLSNHLNLCCPLLLLPSIFPSIWVFSNGLALCIMWSKYWSLLTLSMCHILAESKGLRSQSM